MANNPHALAEAIYDLLEGDGADPLQRFSFVHWFREPDQREWRFIGSLGFDGKFWKSDGRFYVNCYPEDETDERRSTIKRLNDALAALRQRKLTAPCRF